MIAFTSNLLDSQEEYETLGEQYMDIDNLIDYYLIHQYMQTRDGPDDFGHNNMRLVRRNNPAGIWRAYVWDMEYSMIDTTGTRDYSYPFPIYSSTRSSDRDITDSIASLYIRLKDNNPEFQLRYADRAYKHLYNGGALSEQNASARFEVRAEEIASAVVGESARWGDHQRTEPYTRDVEWTTERNRLLTEFFPARPDHVVSQLRINGLYPSIDPPAFSQHGGEVPVGFDLGIAADSGTIYFTTDGSDPREAWTDAVLGTTYSSPLDLTQSTTVKARTLDNGEWSALAEAQFLVGPLANSDNLVISEIFYNPSGGSEELEFIELMNISDSEIDLSNVRFTAGIEFDFAENTRLPAGGRILVVDQTAAFETQYGMGLPVAGEFLNDTSLSNSGERLVLLAADGSVIRDFSYNDKLPWPTAADGDDYSLVLINPATNPDHALPTSWRSSAATGGNPGSSDSVNFAGIDTLGLSIVFNGLSLTLDYTAPIAADDVSISPQWSFDMKDWMPLGDSFSLTAITPSGDGRQLTSFESVAADFGAHQRVFFRLIAVSAE